MSRRRYESSCMAFHMRISPFFHHLQSIMKYSGTSLHIRSQPGALNMSKGHRRYDNQSTSLASLKKEMAELLSP